MDALARFDRCSLTQRGLSASCSRAQCHFHSMNDFSDLWEKQGGFANAFIDERVAVKPEKVCISDALYIWVPSFLSWVWVSSMCISFALKFASQLYFLMDLRHGWPLYFHAFLFSPILLCSTKVQSFCERYTGLLVVLSGVGFFPIIFHLRHMPNLRAFFFGVGFSCLWIILMEGWCKAQVKDRKTHTYAFLCGILLLWIVLYSTYSMNPFVNHRTTSIVALLINTMAGAFLLYRRQHIQALEDTFQILASVQEDIGYKSPQHQFIMPIDVEDIQDTRICDEEEIVSVSTIGSGLCLGGCLFVIMMLYSGYSTAARWSGVQPYPYSLFTLITLALGTLLGASPVLHNPISWVLAMIFVGMLSFGSPSIAFTGSSGLAFITPVFLFGSLRLSHDFDFRSFVCAATLSSLTLSILAVVLSASSSGNRSWISLLFGVVSYGMSCRIRDTSASSTPKDNVLTRTLKRGLSMPPSLVTLFIFFLVCFGQIHSTLIRASGKVPPPPHSKMIPLQPVGIVIGSNDSFPSLYIPPKPLSVFQMNMRQGFDKNGWNNVEEAVEMINFQKMKPLVVGLQEIEANFMWTGNFDIMEYMSYTLKMHDIVGSSPRDSTLGAAILSSLDIKASNSSCFTSRPSPLSCASALVLMVNSTSFIPLEVMVTQGPRNDFYDETVQGAFIAEGLEAISRNDAVLWLGMVVAEASKIPSLINSVFDSHGCPYGSKEEYQFFRNLNLNSSVCEDEDASVFSPIASVYTA